MRMDTNMSLLFSDENQGKREGNNLQLIGEWKRKMSSSKTP